MRKHTGRSQMHTNTSERLLIISYVITFVEPRHSTEHSEWASTLSILMSKLITTINIGLFLSPYLRFSLSSRLSQIHQTENILTLKFSQNISWAQRSHARTENLLYTSHDYCNILLAIVHQLVWWETLSPSRPQCSSVLRYHTWSCPVSRHVFSLRWSQVHRASGTGETWDLAQICLCAHTHPHTHTQHHLKVTIRTLRTVFLSDVPFPFTSSVSRCVALCGTPAFFQIEEADALFFFCGFLINVSLKALP